MNINRRNFLLGGGSAAFATLFNVNPVFASSYFDSARTLNLYNIHTGEKLKKVTYWEKGLYLKDGLLEIFNILRDRRTNETHPIDPTLLDTLFSLQTLIEEKTPTFNIISGYRSPKTNAMLAKNSEGVAKRSFHMKGQAVDISVQNKSLKHVYKAALALKQGGVGYYPRSGFLHLDKGGVRNWGY